MPEIDARNAVQLIILLCAVPLQYYLTTNSSEATRQYELKGLLTTFESFRVNALNATYWKSICSSAFELIEYSAITRFSNREKLENTHGMSSIPAVVDSNDYYAGSQLPRSPRGPHITYRIGQVFTHRKWGYRGVIIGWDETAKAAPKWLKQSHPKNKPNWRLEPNYAVLIDVRDRLIPQLDYVPQEQIVLVEKDTQIMHPNIELYFEKYEGKTYKPRPRIQRVYPHD